MTERLAPDTLLAVRDLKTHFVYRAGAAAKSVDGVSFEVKRGETVAVVGESGSGKSVTSLSIMRLLAEPGRIVSGEILHRDRQGTVRDLAKASAREMRALRGTEIAMIFQEPMTSLNPLFTVGDQIAEMIRLHRKVGRAEALREAGEMLELVEIPAARRRLHDYPHHMSGGMRQRVMIALALANRPSLLIADEPTTALDVTIQAQILDLLRRLQAEMGMSILFITHNLGVVAEIAKSVVVMYAGRVVEEAPVADLFARPKHPYTEGLLASTPNAARDIAADGARRPLVPIPGSVPPITALPPGCAFEPRCAYAAPRCTQSVPPLFALAPARHSRCFRHDAL
ncbi:ABC transporter ATP-binding protein [Aureimonas leprariae]|uniref:ABC transporter ATP-binding protein n=1 Tax=Plantimonas leprariae TaxID=2615207 RepID=A0A7V7PLP0_9HYPH|nr:ABC transporter ATP-binding protein [Aureimonas leprariae]KAB0677223.1 ABC transporter ATP-binding protein [Aureimonas leprariae]